MVYLIILLFILIAFALAPGMLGKKLYKEFAVSMVVLILALLYTLDAAAELEIPEVDLLAELIFEPVAKWVFPNYRK